MLRPIPTGATLADLQTPSGDLLRDLREERKVLIRRGTTCEIRAAGDDTREIEFIASTEGVKRDGHEVIASGMRFENFDRNPVLLWSHDQGEGDRPPLPPIGSIVDRRVEVDEDGKSRLLVRARFATHDLAETVYRLYRDQHMRSVSIGWLPIKTEPIQTDGRQTGVRFLESELLEVSAVPIPADPQAIMQQAQRGLISAEVLGEFARGARLRGGSHGDAYVLDSRDPVTTAEEDDAMPTRDNDNNEEQRDEASEVAEERAEPSEERAETYEDADENPPMDSGRDREVSPEEVQTLVASAMQVAEAVEKLHDVVVEDGEEDAEEPLRVIIDAVTKLHEQADALMASYKPDETETVSDESEDSGEGEAPEGEDIDEEALDGERSAVDVLAALLGDAEKRIGKKISRDRQGKLMDIRGCMRDAERMISEVIEEAMHEAEDKDDKRDERSLSRSVGQAKQEQADDDEGELGLIADLLDDVAKLAN